MAHSSAAGAGRSSAAVDGPGGRRYTPRLAEVLPMKIRNSLKTAKTRDKNCVLVRRKGRLYVLNKKNPRLKARQG